MLVFPKAKINLGLRITGKRADGFHDIETVFYPVGLSDALEMVAGNENSDNDILTVTGLKLPVGPEDNIVLKAVSRLREAYPFPGLRIHLHKNIPAGAGLGGGSSDAVCALKTIKRIFGLTVSTGELKLIAVSLGSDCPFFIDCQPSFASGRGEILTPAGTLLDGFHIVLLNPGILINTREAYDKCLPAMPDTSLADLINRPVSKWKDLIFNDFEKTIFLSHPEISEIKQALYDSGAVFSSMSGSGSCVYGIFKGKPSVNRKIRKLVIFTGEL